MKTFQKIDGPFSRDPNNPRILTDTWRHPVIEMLADAPIWEATEKLDGCNVRIGWDGYRIEFGGRTDRAEMPTFLMEALERIFLAEGVEEWFEEQFPAGPNGESPEVVLFGEGYGPKIQKGGGNYRKDVSFAGFDVLVKDKYLAPANVRDIFTRLGVDVAPVLATGVTLTSLISMVQAGLDSTYGDRNFLAEGLVARTVEPLYDQRGQRLIVKVKPENIPSNVTHSFDKDDTCCNLHGPIV